jgi:CubicO group peptidase (beta-lactamase class C family)
MNSQASLAGSHARIDAYFTTGVLHGHYDSRFEDLVAALADEVTTGGELGAAIAVDIDGELVVDIWGGYADRAKTREWSRDTIVNVFSSTKNVTALAALMLIDRGLLDPFAPVAKYWPEFAANGKERIEVRHVLSHTSGVSGWEMPFTLEDIYDWDKSTSRLAAQAPWWPPGTASGYHAITIGHLVGELVRRVTGTTLKDFVREQISRPLGADFQIGARSEDDERIAELVPPPPLDVPLDAVPEDHPMRKTFAAVPPTSAAALAAETTAWRRAEIGSANGHGNARSLARALSPISLGGSANGVRLLRPETIDLIFEEQANCTDLVLAMPARWGIGFALPHRDAVPDMPDEKVCYWGGWGGSMAVMNPYCRTTFAYVMNQMGQVTPAGTERTRMYTRLIYQALSMTSSPIQYG